MPTYRLDLEYEGTRYHGWQEQTNARSIAGEIRRAVTGAGGDVVELGGAGRTDAGVHALRQTAHLRLRRAIDAEPFRRAVNDALPADIHILALLPAADAFHARHDAASRVYLYQISRRRTAHAKRHVFWVKRPIDAGRMSEAAARLEGRHDFALFCERPGDQPGTLVVVERVEVAAAGALVLVRLTSSHFLWKMVRRCVGVLVRVGAGECSVGDVEGLLAGRLPVDAPDGIAKWTAPASGLFLERVIYPGEGPVPPIAPLTPVPSERLEGPPAGMPAWTPDGPGPFTGSGSPSRASGARDARRPRRR